MSERLHCWWSHRTFNFFFVQSLLKVLIALLWSPERFEASRVYLWVNEERFIKISYNSESTFICQFIVCLQYLLFRIFQKCPIQDCRSSVNTDQRPLWHLPRLVFTVVLLNGFLDSRCPSMTLKKSSGHVFNFLTVANRPIDFGISVFDAGSDKTTDSDLLAIVTIEKHGSIFWGCAS